jgi:antirestriction protein ArdC
MSNQVYDIITSQIIEQLNAGVIPWHQSYVGGMPQNGISKKPYNGINIFLLSVRGFANPFWFTYKQAQEAGGSVRKGEKSTKVIFWKKFTPAYKEDGRQPGEVSEDDLKDHLVMRYYSVFNFEQCEGLSADKYGIKTGAFNPIEEAEAIVKGYNGAPAVVHNEQRAYYAIERDYVNMPKPETFVKPEFYYKTLFHEFTHSTGAAHRLNRKLTGHQAGSQQDYSKEELIAETGASFLSGRAGIFDAPQLEQAAAYIQSWIKVLKNNNKMVIQAASEAQKAADYITGGV